MHQARPTNIAHVAAGRCITRATLSASSATRREWPAKNADFRSAKSAMTSDDLCSRIDVPWRQQQARLRLGGKHCVQRRPGLHRREDLRRVLDEYLHKAGIESPGTASPDRSRGCRRSFGALKQLDVVGEM